MNSFYMTQHLLYNVRMTDTTEFCRRCRIGPKEERMANIKEHTATTSMIPNGNTNGIGSCVNKTR
jgi:hypothetical protein